MRISISKRTSTHAERVFHEILKELKVPFKYKQRVSGREIDFIIGRYAIEIDGHEQSVSKNQMLILEKYIPIHYSNSFIIHNREQIKMWIQQINGSTIQSTGGK